MSLAERMDNMADLDGNVAGPWAGVGTDQIAWLHNTLSNWDKARPVVIFAGRLTLVAVTACGRCVPGEYGKAAENKPMPAFSEDRLASHRA